MSAIKNISLFVPHIFPNFDRNYVAEAFSELGEVVRVDFVSKRDRAGKPFNSAYIHFKKWYNNVISREFQCNVIENGNDKWFHDDSQYYWIVLPNTAKKHIPGERKPRIDLSEFNSNSMKKMPEKLVLKRGEHFVTDVDFKPDNFEDEFANFTEEAMQMAEIEDELDKEDKNLISIDCRYIQMIEQENMWLRAEVGQLRAALINLNQMYQAEAAKVRAFSNDV